MIKLEFVPGVGPMPIGFFIVPDDLADAFLEVAGKPQNFFAGYDWPFLCRGEEYLVHTSYAPELSAIGIEMPAN